MERVSLPDRRYSIINYLVVLYVSTYTYYNVSYLLSSE
jgi:hypothetical protein